MLLPLLAIGDAAGGDRCKGGGGEVEAVVRVEGVVVVEEGVDGVQWDSVLRTPEEKTCDRSYALIQPLVSVAPPHHTTITSSDAGRSHRHSYGPQ